MEEPIIRPDEDALMEAEEKCRKAMKTVGKAIFMRIFVTGLLIWVLFQTEMELWIIGMMAFVLIINLSGLLFFNTLYDENAVCHLAVGMGYKDCLTDYHNRTLEEGRALGLNDSMIHVDFMIGCDTMNIDAICRNGETVRIFENGQWTF